MGTELNQAFDLSLSHTMSSPPVIMRKGVLIFCGISFMRTYENLSARRIVLIPMALVSSLGSSVQFYRQAGTICLLLNLYFGATQFRTLAIPLYLSNYS